MSSPPSAYGISPLEGGERGVERLTRARLRQLRELKTAAGRREQQAFLIDGEKLVRDALAARAPVLEVLSTQPQQWASAGVPLSRISRADAERLSDTRTPQGDFALVRDNLPPSDAIVRGLMADPTWLGVALDRVQDPGNVGAIIRSAAAFDANVVLVGPGSADPTHPRVTRAATGAWFDVPIVRSESLAADLAGLRAAGVRVIAADSGGTRLDEIGLEAATIWVFGNEGAGVRAELDSLIDVRAAVPIASTVESLNVAVAAGIILHYASRAAPPEGSR